MAPDLVWHWRPRNSSDLSHLNIPLAVQRFVSDQLDLASKETNGQHKLHWKHDDLRQCSLDTRRERKVRLCQRIPGLLSGAHWSALHLDSWLPIYVVLAKLSPSELISTNYATDLRYYSVVWEHESGSLGLSIYSNHHDPQLILQHFSDNMLSTSDHGVEKLGNKTRTSLSHAAQYLFQLTKKAAPKDDTSSLSSQSPSASSGLSLRLGNSVGVLGWRKAQDGFADQATLQLSDLTPPSLEPSQKSQGLPLIFATTIATNISFFCPRCAYKLNQFVFTS
ncbi:hypothetical protein CERSUDRAFT_96998 [Gelatoporia subvermispora B]|uniref:Uncharacterized protein n=1 Tax=Ceriporiopsis subvermispora (strain B) TaxID=914234 RepID=M2R8P5_CERS8|nr:hypothetical protein CERSUDRAFT_96998 [Gelatoporia subvermispora B]